MKACIHWSAYWFGWTFCYLRNNILDCLLHEEIQIFQMKQQCLEGHFDQSLGAIIITSQGGTLDDYRWFWQQFNSSCILTLVGHFLFVQLHFLGCGFRLGGVVCIMYIWASMYAQVCHIFNSLFIAWSCSLPTTVGVKVV